MEMSRFEEILKAMVNGEDCDLTPQSREEVLLLALTDTIRQELSQITCVKKEEIQNGDE